MAAAAFSAIITVVKLVLARGMTGITDASTAHPTGAAGVHIVLHRCEQPPPQRRFVPQDRERCRRVVERHELTRGADCGVADDLGQVTQRQGFSFAGDLVRGTPRPEAARSVRRRSGRQIFDG